MKISVLGNKLRVEIIILCMLVGAFIACNVFFTCAGGLKEGFALVGAAVEYVMETPNTASLSSSDTTSNNVFSKLENNHVDYSEPLPEGQMAIFAQNTLSPSCCPAAYSGSTGCVCATPEQMKFISMRGGNKTTASSV
tara:strand:+ start:1075 stop:1488 length:414 start_codon:yes stop_codon:yes gene_type:complete